MKKFNTYLLFLFILILSITGCNTPSSNNAESVTQAQEVEGSLEDILQKIYDNLDDSVQLPALMSQAITPDMQSPGIDYYLGSTEIAFTEGLASEPLMTSQAFSLVLIRLDKDADIEQTKTLIKETVNPQKWICVGVDPSNVIVDNIGSLVVLIMSDNAQELHDSFLKLQKS